MADIDQVKLAERYERIRVQLKKLFEGYTDPIARMATSSAVLHHKNSHFFWSGYYRLVDGDLVVGPYQGPLACAVLKPRGSGVCWAGIEQNRSILVHNVHEFEGHIACDSRSQSEVVVPVRNRSGETVGVFDVDSTKVGAFCEADVKGLETIVEMVFGA